MNLEELRIAMLRMLEMRKIRRLQSKWIHEVTEKAVGRSKVEVYRNLMKSFTIMSVGCPNLEYLQQHLSQIFEFGESPVAVEQGLFVRNSLISFNS